MASFFITREAFGLAIERLTTSGVHQIAAAFLALKFLGVNVGSYVEVRSSRDFQKKFWEPFLGVKDPASEETGFFKLFEAAIAYKGNYAHGSQFTPLREQRKPVGKNSLTWERDEIGLPPGDSTNYRVRFKPDYVKVIAEQLTDAGGKRSRIPLDALAVYFQAMEGELSAESSLAELMEIWKKKLSLTPLELAEWFDESPVLSGAVGSESFSSSAAKAVLFEKFAPPMLSEPAAVVAPGVVLPSHNVIVAGPPGSGKSTLVDGWTKSAIRIRTVFHADTTRADFIGTIRPLPHRSIDDNGNEVVRTIFDFVPGPLITAIVRALKSPDKEVYLVVEEINRADAASVFAEALQLLDRDEHGVSLFPIAPGLDLLDFIQRHDIGFEELFLPPNLRIIATMNTSDESLRPMDSAFKRRWDWHEQSPSSGASATKGLVVEGGGGLLWNDFVHQLNARILDVRPGDDCRIGLYFLRSVDGVISQRSIQNKLLPYLWQDVHRHGSVPLFSAECTSLQAAQDLLQNDGLHKLFDWLDVPNGAGG